MAALCVMMAVVDLLGITELEVAQGALRQGALHDLLDHEPPADKEAAEISALQLDFGVDVPHALRVQRIAAEHLFVETLETRNSDRLDFYDVSVWGIRQALINAYEAGRLASSTNTAN